MANTKTKVNMIEFPCLARDLEAELHKTCDHHGLWDAELDVEDGKLVLSEKKGEEDGR